MQPCSPVARSLRASKHPGLCPHSCPQLLSHQMTVCQGTRGHWTWSTHAKGLSSMACMGRWLCSTSLHICWAPVACHPEAIPLHARRRAVLDALKALRAEVSWDTMQPSQFAIFYAFVFHLARVPGRKHVQVCVLAPSIATTQPLWHCVVRHLASFVHFDQQILLSYNSYGVAISTFILAEAPNSELHNDRNAEPGMAKA